MKVSAPKRLQRRLVLRKNDGRQRVRLGVSQLFSVAERQFVALYVVNDELLCGEARAKVRGDQRGDIVVRRIVSVIYAGFRLQKTQRCRSACTRRTMS